MSVNEREIVLDMLLRVDSGKLGHTVLKDTLDSYLYLDKVSRGFITRLYEGTVEKKIYLDFVINSFSKLPVRKLKPIIRIIMENAVYQIFFMDRVPDSAAINEAVKLAKKRGFSGLSGFVNGVLRNIAGNKENIKLPDKAKDRIKYIEVKYSMPEFVVKHFEKEYGLERAEGLIKAFEEYRCISGRVNRLKTDKESLVGALEKEGVKVSTDTVFEDSVKILELDNLNFVESFKKGEFIIQDESSGFLGEIVRLPENAKVIDLCAAPGGKSLMFAMKEEVAEVIACDISEMKKRLIEENVLRTGLTKIKTQINDAAVYNEAFKEAADLVICDLPCSGLGIMGRKRDIKYNVTQERIDELAELQKQILLNAREYVKKGGLLLFSTCTLSRKENEENFTFISKFKDFTPVDFSDKIPIRLLGTKSGIRLAKEAESGYMRLFPDEFGTDGFFISQFVREK